MSEDSNNSVEAARGTEAQPLILLVDDDLASLIMSEEALEDAGFSVLQAENGHEAVALCEQHSPDLIIMDVIMPKMNGFDACTAIRATDWGKYVPILMVTGLEDIESINRAYEVGATDFLTKPVNFFVLPHRVRYMLRSKGTADDLRASQSQLDQAQRIAQLGHWEWNRSTRKTNWSPACLELFPVESMSQDADLGFLFSMVHTDDRATVEESFKTAVQEAHQYNVEFRVSMKDGEIRVVRQQAEPQCDENGRCISMLGTVQDITERYNTQKQIHALAYYDHVTGLPNRALLYDRLATTLNHAKRYNKKFAVLFLDLDRFKLVNDTLGHDAGDDLLTQVSGRLTETLRRSDHAGRKLSDSEGSNLHTIARLGGDEFVVLLSEITKSEDAARVAKRIAKKIAENYDISGSGVNISTTIGISVYPFDGADPETLLKNADIAMYHAKKRGPNGYQFYSEDIQRNAQERFSLEQELRRAIEGDQFRLMYQPKICSKTNEVSGVEALVRWDHPTMGEVAPQDFITLAEETELIIPLGEWIVNTACEQAKKWHGQGLTDLQVAVNCSSIQLMRTNIPELLVKVLDRTGLDPKFMEIELTESLLLSDAERGIQILQDLRETGITTSIDDFGTGFSSMSYLRRLPVHKLKIDKSFVQELGVEKSDSAIVVAILTLAKHLDLKVVAEGVETQEQLDFLVEHDCDELQGYFISKPLTPENFIQWFRERDQQLLKKAG